VGRDDWYRNKVWDTATEAAFRAKLARARKGRAQYLKIQAGYLVGTHPFIALQLIDEYFETGDRSFVPAALCARAEAHLALSEIKEAVVAYKRALEWEQTHPNHITTARVDLPILIAEHRLRNEYDYALEVLESRFTVRDHQFPSTRYYWNGSNALIAHDLGQIGYAREFAERALRAASEIKGPFRHHAAVGLVTSTSDDFGTRLKRIARTSMLRPI
jgi:tetratricopeptide (TPR) repeat protein